VDSINPLNRLAAIIRQEAAKQKLKLGAKSKPPLPEQHELPEPVPQSLESLHAVLVSKLQALPEGEANRGRKVARTFVEQTLLWKFGPELINDTQFADMVDEIAKLMQEDAPAIERYLKE